MTWPLPELSRVLDGVTYDTGRIDKADAARQHVTLKEILSRLANQPGLVLADEVGMGKTFVALGAAYLAATQDRGGNPAVVMIPPALRNKWPLDAELFREKCLPAGTPLRVKVATTGLEFLRILDDPRSQRAQIILLHHGAFLLDRIDHWMKLALIKRAMHGARFGPIRETLPRFIAEILRVKSRYQEEMFRELLRTPCEYWKSTINSHCTELPDLKIDDDPIPERVDRVLQRRELDLSKLREALDNIPIRSSAYLADRLKDVRWQLGEAMKALWPQVLKEATFRSPLLVLDEAHHLKNAGTKLASLFADGKEDVETISGALAGRFERMIFLTATPFQLGHAELISVLDRFNAVQWRSLPTMNQVDYQAQLRNLHAVLDNTQRLATNFDRLWQRLPRSSAPSSLDDESLDAWWKTALNEQGDGDTALAEIARGFKSVRNAMQDAEAALRPWVIRHDRGRHLPGSEVLRRRRALGRAILDDKSVTTDGLPVTDEQLLPFLLAARAHIVAERAGSGRRPTFADGLASSYEAFLETSAGAKNQLDEVEETEHSTPAHEVYIAKLRAALPAESAYSRHPKIAAVIARVVKLWELGEKVVVFCHYRKTGQALLKHISQALDARLWAALEDRIHLPRSEAAPVVARFGERFDADGAMTRHLRVPVSRLIAEEPFIAPDEADQLQAVIRRFVRSPIFIARYFDPQQPSSEELVNAAMATRDSSGFSLEDRLREFLKFFAKRTTEERKAYLNALDHVQPGIRGEPPKDGDNDAGTGTIRLPNVRLVNGETDHAVRHRAMLGFNTPFFPDVLVASSVLAEGVDLHLHCRHVIHHDLSWNPSDIEQRTGRVDRLGCRAERAKESVDVYLPFVSETQDEKQFRVVMDRERWFQVLMGEEYRPDDTDLTGAAERVPLPAAALKELNYKLTV